MLPQSRIVSRPQATLPEKTSPNDIFINYVFSPDLEIHDHKLKFWLCEFIDIHLESLY